MPQRNAKPDQDERLIQVPVADRSQLLLPVGNSFAAKSPRLAISR
jgi:hypothetical protein